MLRRLTIILAVIVLCGCGRIPGGPKAYGDSSASRRTGDITTTTDRTIYPDRVVEQVVEECKHCIVEKADGGPGSSKLYEMMGTVFSAILGTASIVIQVLK